jgi:hypothetical protein
VAPHNLAKPCTDLGRTIYLPIDSFDHRAYSLTTFQSDSG